ncbi:uncharacterized protein LOC112592526 [Melanaphis sacchari]|uniref:uncharacterized protein LOC112592526 n=1 Tax=Melanaphis sacchari TaxID=742174 RepID=UPI000DC13C55|nr:uncharacterized protein LOC112592526 [Melanaphis sacchari]
MRECLYEKKRYKKLIKEFEKLSVSNKNEIALKDATIICQRAKLQRTILHSKGENKLVSQGQRYAIKVRDLNNIIHAHKKESIELKQKINELENTVIQLKNDSINFKRSIKNVTLINQSIVESNYEKPRSYSLEESLQNKIYRLEDQINKEKSKNTELLTQINTIKSLKQIEYEANSKNLSDALKENQRLINLKNNLVSKNITLEKLKGENNLLKHKTKDKENRLRYMQNKFVKLDNQTTTRILNTKILEMVHPEKKLKRLTNVQLIKNKIEQSDKLNKSNLEKKEKYVRFSEEKKMTTYR